jgi:hypothetical protein
MNRAVRDGALFRDLLKGLYLMRTKGASGDKESRMEGQRLSIQHPR